MGGGGDAGKKRERPQSIRCRDAVPGHASRFSSNTSDARDCRRSASGKQGYRGRTATKGRNRPTRQLLQGAAQSSSARIND